LIVENLAFDTGAPVDPVASEQAPPASAKPQTLMEKLQSLPPMVLAACGGGAIVLIGLMWFLMRSRRLLSAAREATETLATQAQQTAMKDPELCAAVLRSWMAQER
jgi:hypothetical protein